MFSVYKSVDDRESHYNLSDHIMKAVRAPVSGIKHHTSWLRASLVNQYAMTCASCWQFSHLPNRLGCVGVVQFLTFNVNRETVVHGYTVISINIRCICIVLYCVNAQAKCTYTVGIYEEKNWKRFWFRLIVFQYFSRRADSTVQSDIQFQTSIVTTVWKRHIGHRFFYPY